MKRNVVCFVLSVVLAGCSSMPEILQGVVPEDPIDVKFEALIDTEVTDVAENGTALLIGTWRTAKAKGHVMVNDIDFDYDIAFSFAGEDRAPVEQLASRLTQEGVRVFYDAYEKAALWGKDLYQHLQVVYRDRARFCIIFGSAAYANKLWTRHELKQAQSRAFKEHREYILPVRLDDYLYGGAKLDEQ